MTERITKVARHMVEDRIVGTIDHIPTKLDI